MEAEEDGRCCDEDVVEVGHEVDFGGVHEVSGHEFVGLLDEMEEFLEGRGCAEAGFTAGAEEDREYADGDLGVPGGEGLGFWGLEVVGEKVVDEKDGDGDCFSGFEGGREVEVTLGGELLGREGEKLGLKVGWVEELEAHDGFLDCGVRPGKEVQEKTRGVEVGIVDLH